MHCKTWIRNTARSVEPLEKDNALSYLGSDVYNVPCLTVVVYSLPYCACRTGQRGGTKLPGFCVAGSYN